MDAVTSKRDNMTKCYSQVTFRSFNGILRNRTLLMVFSDSWHLSMLEPIFPIRNGTSDSSTRCRRLAAVVLVPADELPETRLVYSTSMIFYWYASLVYSTSMIFYLVQ